MDRAEDQTILLIKWIKKVDRGCIDSHSNEGNAMRIIENINFLVFQHTSVGGTMIDRIRLKLYCLLFPHICCVKLRCDDPDCCVEWKVTSYQGSMLQCSRTIVNSQNKYYSLL